MTSDLELMTVVQNGVDSSPNPRFQCNPSWFEGLSDFPSTKYQLLFKASGSYITGGPNWGKHTSEVFADEGVQALL